MPRRLTSLLPLLLLSALTLTLAASAAGSGHRLSIAAFHTPSGNIMCDATSAVAGYPAFLRCDMVSGLKPRPKRPAHCDFDYGQTLELSASGRGVVGCVSDAVERGRALAYGKTWRRFGFSCLSQFSGLTCRNGKGHGFFLSRARWRVW